MVNSGILAQIFEESGMNESDLMVFAGIMLVYFAFFSIIAVALYLLQAFGLYGMAKGSGIGRPWRGFIPFANTFLFGKIAERYVKKDGKKSAKFGGLLLAFEILTAVFAVAVFAFVINAFSVLFAHMLTDSEITVAIGYSFVPVIIFFLVFTVAAIAYAVMYYVALWRIFAAFDYHNATVYLVLSIVFSFLGPIFLFVLRNKQPVFDTREHFSYLYKNQK